MILIDGIHIQIILSASSLSCWLMFLAIRVGWRMGVLFFQHRGQLFIPSIEGVMTSFMGAHLHLLIALIFSICTYGLHANLLTKQNTIYAHSSWVKDLSHLFFFCFYVSPGFGLTTYLANTMVTKWLFFQLVNILCQYRVNILQSFQTPAGGNGGFIAISHFQTKKNRLSNSKQGTYLYKNTLDTNNRNSINLWKYTNSKGICVENGRWRWRMKSGMRGTFPKPM